MNIYDEIKSKVLLSSVISQSVQLVKKGNTYLGLCPFHSEKTPSFTVSDQKGIYYCFGCHAGGDLINFLEKHRGYSHFDALNILCNQLGIELNPEFVNKSVKNKSIFAITSFVMIWYQNELLKNQKLLSYLTKTRKISESSIKKFGLGYSCNNNELISTLEKNYGESDIIGSGLFRKKESVLYAFFYNRLMFPIIDNQSRVIAFGGRVINQDSDGPKYINSPETDIFAKRQNLFNIQNVKNVKDQDLFLVEGYIDVIALDSIGVKAVAPLGTALSEYHVASLWKLTDNPILCFDGDKAGRKSSLLVAEKILLYLHPGKRISFMFLPDGQDPDDFVHSCSPEEAKIAWNNLSEQKLGLGGFIWASIKNQYLSDDSPESKLSAIEYVDQITSGIKDLSVKGYYVDYLKKEIKYYKSKKKISNNLQFKNDSDLKRLFLDKRVEIQILAMLVYHPRLIDENLDFISGLNFSHDILGILRDNILSVRFENNVISSDGMIKGLTNFVLSDDAQNEVIGIISYIIGDVFKSTYLWTNISFDPNESWLEIAEIYRKQNSSDSDENWDALVDMTKHYKSK